MHTETHSSENIGHSKLEYLDSGIAVVRLGDPKERVVTLTKDRMASLSAIIKHLKNERPKGVIILGPGPEMFTAGADINMIGKVTSIEIGEGLAREGQILFDDLESLPCITVAAISGPCVGGGCELVLACDYRIISDHKNSIIGLPETKLGILPGFGGTQRLPRLIGLPKALDIILAGKTLRPKQAKAAGLVDEVIPFEALKDRATKIILNGEKRRSSNIKFLDKLLTFTGIGRSLIRYSAGKALHKQTRGFYPAPPAALNACIFGLENGMQAGLKHEARELGRMIVTPECKSLVKIFFLTEASKAVGKGARDLVKHSNVVVIGAGVMGAGIAHLFAQNDSSVILKDTTEEALSRGVKHIKDVLAKAKYLSDQERSFILNRVEITTKDSPNFSNSQFAIEAIFEDMDLKKKVLADVASKMPEDSIILTNTSSLSVTQIGAGIPNPSRVAGMHFFNPVDKMPLVEIIRSEQTTDRVVAIVAALTTKLGKYPIVVSDVPGFLVNRILTPYLNEAGFLLAEGFSIADIDKAAVRFGMPMGPLRLLDEVGLDVAAHVAEVMLKGYGERMKAPEFPKALNTLGRKGRKNNAGFYDFKDKEATPHAAIRELLKINTPAKTVTDLKEIEERLVMSLLNEAVLCLDEGVAGSPGNEAANQIDLGTVMGMGFPPFRGGIMHYADTLGAKSILERMERLNKSFGLRFESAPGIAKRAASGRSFHEQA